MKTFSFEMREWGNDIEGNTNVSISVEVDPAQKVLTIDELQDLFDNFVSACGYVPDSRISFDPNEWEWPDGEES